MAVPPSPGVRKRVVKAEEEGGFHSNRLVSRETRGEMSAELGLVQGGGSGWSPAPRSHRVTAPPKRPLHPPRRGRSQLTPKLGGCV